MSRTNGTDFRSPLGSTPRSRLPVPWADAAYPAYKRNRPSGDQLFAQREPALFDRNSSSSSPSPLASFWRRLLLLNVKTIRLPSGDQTGKSASPPPSVNRV